MEGVRGDVDPVNQIAGVMLGVPAKRQGLKPVVHGVNESLAASEGDGQLEIARGAMEHLEGEEAGDIHI